MSGTACSSAGIPSMPLFPGIIDVHQDDVGLVLHRLEHGALRVRGLADRLDVGLGVEHAPEPAADDGVVVDDEHADAHGMRHLRDEVVPDPTADSTRRRPPTSPTRSRMPTSPRTSSRVESPVEAPAVVLDDRRDGPVTSVSAGCSRATHPRA